MIKNLLVTTCLIIGGLAHGQYSMDFESGTLSPIVRAGAAAQATAVNASNPSTTDINPSATAFQITLTDTAPAWRWLAIQNPGGTYGVTDGTWCKFKILSTNETAVDVQLEPWFGGARYLTNTVSLSGLTLNTWYEVEFNFEEAVKESDNSILAGTEPGYLSRLDIKLNATGTYDGDVFYIDDITQNAAMTLSTVKSKKINDLAVYPNPTNGKVNIVSPGVTVESIKVYNVIGALVSTSADLTNLVNGVYFMKLNTDAGKVTKRIVKQ
ncbi:T9SS type A sorting domain-containing protein [Algibacter amylolyticus]|uniref:T9SS type A sorting domain-containing protein n=1 Tax=Algibacter amylolyticus TaxID=1608400 RepID=A0A5M7B8P8_9FLAO|nr:T9SS type A sorting domain-containing protein [Algibacter amylolyticus]KAA5823715.1 T9SS type A sorting domain-containing protein [Algibacter amylolyticus]MBB5267885.1 hypothetical protein [Algibacter amylolyticus]TSJ74203.1 T9SS type A sorting domain-containing protein [Algibacter amylolyticus]